MPTAPAAPPPVPATAVAPTPGVEYKLSAHEPTSPIARDPALNAALARRAGVAPTQSEPKNIPAQPPIPTEKPDASPKPADDKPAPHVKFVAADDKEPVAPVAKAEPESPKTNELPPEVIKNAPAQLREAYDKLKREFTERATEGDLTKKELAEFKSKAKNYEDRIKALESIEGRAKEMEKQLLTYDEQLRVTNYLQHPEFHEKYVKPVADAVQSAIALVKDLSVEEADGSIRSGNEQDFQEVLAQPNTTMAARKAKELFGSELATTVLEARQRVRSAQEAQSKAVKEAGLKSQEWVKSQQERAAAARANARAEFEKVSSSLASKYPSLYLPPEGDQDALAARQKGEELARLIIDGQPEDMPVDAYLNNVAKIYHRAAAFPMREVALQKLQAELEATKARLAAYEKSTPDTSSRQQPGGVTQDAGGTIVTSADDLRAKMRASLEKRANRY